MPPPLTLPVKFLRSATVGRRPGDGTFRALTDGEFFVNTADLVLCFLNAQGGLVTFSLTQALYALRASPALSGTPTAPTPAVGDSSGKLATTGFVAAAVNALLAGAPAALDTLKELADAIGDDANFAGSITAALNNRLRGDAAVTYTPAQIGQFLSNLSIASFLRAFLGKTTQTDALSAIGAQAALGYKPVQAGGGSGGDGSAHNVLLTWSAAAQLLAQIDSSPLGQVWTDNNAPRSLQQSGYQKLPGGFIIQWGYLNPANADFQMAFPTAFPANLCYFGASILGQNSENQLISATVDQPGLTGAVIRRRSSVNGSTAPAAIAVYWMALGY